MISRPVRPRSEAAGADLLTIGAQKRGPKPPRSIGTTVNHAAPEWHGAMLGGRLPALAPDHRVEKLSDQDRADETDAKFEVKLHDLLL